MIYFFFISLLVNLALEYKSDKENKINDGVKVRWDKRDLSLNGKIADIDYTDS